MSPSWRSVEDRVIRPSSDFASEILWRAGVPLAVFDGAGRLAFSNPAFQESPLSSAGLDGRGFLSRPELERLRLLALRPGEGGPALEITLADLGVRVEAQALRLVPGWVALVAYVIQGPPQDRPDLPSPQLLLHELRAPLLAIREAQDRLTQKAEGLSSDLRLSLDRQAAAVGRLTRVLAAVADLARADQLREQRASWESVDLARLVGEAGDTYEALAAAQGLQLVTEIESGVPPIRGDPQLLSRAVANLVENALKYSAPPGPVRVSLRLRGALAVLAVSDSGSGIPLQDRSRIFEPFVRLAEARARRSEGSGLGLAVVARVARAHGASVLVESEAGVGSTFRLSFLISTGTLWAAPSAVPAPGPASM